MNKSNYKTAEEKILAINAHMQHLNLTLYLEEQEHAYLTYANNFNMNVIFKNHNYRFRVKVKKRLVNRAALARFIEQLSLQDFDSPVNFS